MTSIKFLGAKFCTESSITGKSIIVLSLNFLAYPVWQIQRGTWSPPPPSRYYTDKTSGVNCWIVCVNRVNSWILSSGLANKYQNYFDSHCWPTCWLEFLWRVLSQSSSLHDRSSHSPVDISWIPLRLRLIVSLACNDMKVTTSNGY